MRPKPALLTPTERLELRREWRAWSRWFLKHYWSDRFPRMGHYEAQELAWAKFLVGLVQCARLAMLLKNLLIPKFCNGLIGVSLTDNVTAPAI
jgi:hypothetical protein